MPATHKRKGSVICGNDLAVPQESAEQAILEGAVANLLDAQALSELLEAAYRRVVTPGNNKRERQIERQLKKIDTELANLVAAVAAGGNAGLLVQAIKDKESEKGRLNADLQALIVARQAAPTDPAAVRGKLEKIVADWRGCLQKRPQQARDRLKTLIVDRIVFTPREDERGRFYELNGVGTVEPILRGLAPHNVASPTGFEPVF